MSFLETPVFPESISMNSAGGPEYEVSIVAVESGFEQRNLEQDEPLHWYDVEHGIKEESDLWTLVEYFHAVKGPLHEFRFKDYADFNTATPPMQSGVVARDDMNMNPSVGDGSDTTFQLQKQYAKGALTTTREIKKPVSGTILVEVNGVLMTEGGGADYTIDYATGIVTFAVAPVNLVTVKWGGEFSTPCRFETKRLDTNWVSFNAGQQSVLLREVRVA